MARASGQVQRGLVLAGAVELGQQRPAPVAPGTDGGDPSGQLAGTAAAVVLACLLLPDVARVEPPHVLGQLLVRLADELRQRAAREVAVLVVHRPDPRAVHREELAAEQVEPAAQDHELPECTSEGGPVLALGVGDRLEARTQAPDEPDHLDVAARLSLEPPTRAHPVEAAVDVELQQIGRRVAGPPGGLRLHPSEARPTQIEPAAAAS